MARYTDSTGYIQFNVPAGMDTAYLSQLCWSSGGYADVYGVQSDGGLVFLRRINTRQTIENTNEGSNAGNNNQHDGSTITLAASGLSYFSAIRIQNRSGRLHLTGLGFTSAKLHGAEGVGLVHPQQLSIQGSGSGLDADLLDGLHANQIVPSGIITLWSGSSASIPSGWALCNGANGTPNLQDRFVVGAGSGYGVGATGGASTVALSAANMPSHTHSFSGTTSTATLSGDLVAGKPNISGTGIVTRTQTGIGGSGSGSQASGARYNINATHNHTVSGTTGSTGSGTAHENRPPYYALCYIMKL